MRRDVGKKESNVYVRHSLTNHRHSPDNTIVQKLKHVGIFGNCFHFLVFKEKSKKQFFSIFKMKNTFGSLFWKTRFSKTKFRKFVW